MMELLAIVHSNTSQDLPRVQRDFIYVVDGREQTLGFAHTCVLGEHVVQLLQDEPGSTDICASSHKGHLLVHEHPSHKNDLSVEHQVVQDVVRVVDRHSQNQLEEEWEKSPNRAIDIGFEFDSAFSFGFLVVFDDDVEQGLAIVVRPVPSSSDRQHFLCWVWQQLSFVKLSNEVLHSRT